MTVALRSLLLVLLVLAADPALAQQGAAVSEEPVVAENAEDEVAAWVARLDEAAKRLAAAQKRVAELEGAKGRGASRRYPRGEAKEKYLEQLEEARTELAEAQEAMPELLEDARRAGVLPGVLDRYETAAAGAPEQSDE